MLIEILDLKLKLGGNTVLSDINLHLEKGQIYGLLGPNGAGKSTTITAITGLRPPTSGSIQVLGLDPRTHALQLHRRIGVLAEQAGFYDWMTATEYLQWVATLYQVDPDKSTIANLLERVGLNSLSKAPIGVYSRGMRQRLGLARALINQPELLILDEPTNGLDPRGRREIHNVLLDLSANHGVGVLLCTHLLDDVDRLCNRIGIIAQGRTVLEGNIADLLSSQRAAVRYRLRVESGKIPDQTPKGIRVLAHTGEWWHVEIINHYKPQNIWLALLEAGLPIIEIQREGGGLEELYLSTTENREVA